MTPPRKAMSLPARSPMCLVAIALVRVNRGSMWTTSAPRSLASITHWNQTGHRGAVSYASLVLDLHHPERRHQLLDDVVLLVVECGAAEVREAHRALRRVALRRRLLPGFLARREDPVDDHLHRILERELL